MLSVKTDEATGVVELEVDGTVEHGEYDAAVAALEAAIARDGKARVVEIVRSFTGMDASLWWHDVTWGFSNISKFARVAVVTDSGWIGPLTRAVAALMPSEVRVFGLADLEEARAWARGLPTS